jgi:16S rRNA (cytidine1402-2'-O)-methyltransferase
MMSGKLYLCGTPIGNLEDLTYRAARILGEVDLIAAEDTRQTAKLLNHLEIKKAMISYHEHNKREKGLEIAEKLKSGLNIALVTDAGMPGVSDPGEDLVKLCIDEGIDVEVIPGATASITALVLSGFSTGKFIFEGFLPREGRERKEAMEYLKNEARTVIIYEAPHRIRDTLKDLFDNLGNRRVAVCRELTKKFEEVIRVGLLEASTLYEKSEPRGEFVIVLEGRDIKEMQEEERKSWDSVSVEEHIDMYVKQGMSRKDAMKKAAKDRGLSKRDIYKYTIDQE